VATFFHKTTHNKIFYKKTRVGGRGKAMPGDQWTAATYSDVLEVEAAFRNRIHISGQLCMTKNGGLCTD